MTGARVYLDTCLQQRGIRALLPEARAEPAVAQDISRRNAEFAEKCKADFDALRRRHPVESAQLWVAMIAEAALIELADGAAGNDVRAAIEEFLG